MHGFTDRLSDECSILAGDPHSLLISRLPYPTYPVVLVSFQLRTNLSLVDGPLKAQRSDLRGLKCSKTVKIVGYVTESLVGTIFLPNNNKKNFCDFRDEPNEFLSMAKYFLRAVRFLEVLQFVCI